MIEPNLEPRFRALLTPSFVKTLTILLVHRPEQNFPAYLSVSAKVIQEENQSGSQ
jgi:hypothetical protein